MLCKFHCLQLTNCLYIYILIIRFVLNTDIAAINVKELLQQLYAKVWVEYVVRDPLWTPGTVVTSELFQSKLDEFVKQSPIFGIRNI